MLLQLFVGPKHCVPNLGRNFSNSHLKIHTGNTYHFETLSIVIFERASDIREVDVECYAVDVAKQPWFAHLRLVLRNFL